MTSNNMSTGFRPRRTPPLLALALVLAAVVLQLLPEIAEAFTYIHTTKPSSSVRLPSRGHARLLTTTTLRVATTAPLPPPPVKEEEDDVDVRAVPCVHPLYLGVSTEHSIHFPFYTTRSRPA